MNRFDKIEHQEETRNNPEERDVKEQKNEDEFPDDVVEDESDGEFPDDVVEDDDDGEFPDDVVDDEGDGEFPDDVVEDDDDGEFPDDDVEDDDENDLELEKEINNYIDDLKEKSEFPETIPSKPFDASDLKKISPEENARMREEFMDKKNDLKREWEEKNGCSWPKYDHDVYSANGRLIRKAGSDYDAHHIHPLGMGGKNEASNITPLSAEVHYDKQGVHAPDSPYSKINNTLGGPEK